MITVLHEEKDFIIISKPAGLITHADGKPNSIHVSSVAEEVLKLYPEIQGIGESSTFGNTSINRSGIVHRLDTDTSGVMIIPCTQVFFDHVKKQFQDHVVEKEYKAFVWGWLKEEDKKGVIHSPIGKSGSDFRKYVTGRYARGVIRDAITYYDTLAQFEADAEDAKLAKPHLPRFSYMSLKPKTGRTHQIRVHMKHIHHGIVSDSLYMENHPKVLGFERQALHAEHIRFFDLQGNERHFSAPLPDDFVHVCKKYSL